MEQQMWYDIINSNYAQTQTDTHTHTHPPMHIVCLHFVYSQSEEIWVLLPAVN